MAQFAYNSSKSSTTGRTPFYANYGYEPTAYRETAPTASSSHGINEEATRKVEELRSLHDKLREKIAQGNEKMAQQANKKRIEGPILKGGDKVYLLTKNLPTLRLSKKLNAIRIGPFEVKKRIKEVNYELRLPKNMRIRPVFHISLLEPAPADAPLETDIEMEPDQTDYEVEQLLDVRKFGNQWRYLVKWKNYPSEENSWEPIKCLKDCPKRLEQFHQRNPQRFDPRRQNQKAQPSQAVASLRDSKDESHPDQQGPSSQATGVLSTRDPKPNSQQADFRRKSSQQRAVEPRLEKMESSHSRLAPAVPTLQWMKGPELRTRHHVPRGIESAFEDAPRGRAHLQQDAGKMKQRQIVDQPPDKPLSNRIGAFRDFSPRKTTCVPTQTNRSDSHETDTLCKNRQSQKGHKDVLLSRKQNTGASRRGPNEAPGLLGQYDGQHEFDPCPSRRKEETSVPTDRRGHVDPLYRAARQGCQPPRRTRSASRTKLEKERARVIGSQSDCPSQPGRVQNRSDGGRRHGYTKGQNTAGCHVTCKMDADGTDQSTPRQVDASVQSGRSGWGPDASVQGGRQRPKWTPASKAKGERPRSE